MTSWSTSASDDPQSGGSLCNLVLNTVSISDVASTLEALRSANICNLTALHSIDRPAWVALQLPNNDVRAQLQAAIMDAVGIEAAVVVGNTTVPPSVGCTSGCTGGCTNR